MSWAPAPSSSRRRRPVRQAGRQRPRGDFTIHSRHLIYVTLAGLAGAADLSQWRRHRGAGRRQQLCLRQAHPCLGLFRQHEPGGYFRRRRQSRHQHAVSVGARPAGCHRPGHRSHGVDHHAGRQMLRAAAGLAPTARRWWWAPTCRTTGTSWMPRPASCSPSYTRRAAPPRTISISAPTASAPSCRPTASCCRSPTSKPPR